MAAAREPLMDSPEVVDLRRVTGREMEPLLLEETVEWDRELDWDFRKSAELVHQYADARGLQGVAMLRQGEIAGYGYAVVDDHKGLVGDLYVRPMWRSPETEAWLLGLILQALGGTGQVRRIESQLMLLGMATGRILERHHPVRLYERVLMTLDLKQLEPADDAGPYDARGPAFGTGRFRVEPWGEQHYDAVAAIITSAYRGHVDSEINDQYRTQSGAHRFLYNIVQYPGCGNFFRAASYVAFDRTTGAPAGVVLSSIVGPATGHITQLCITPAAQGQGLGTVLLRKALSRLRAHGLKRVSLTVTMANRMALQLYHRIGFREVRRFLACVWEAERAGGRRP